MIINMTREELTEELLGMGEDPRVLRRASKAELMERYDNLTDESIMYPNGRDFDAEDEDWY